jgi:hypothetical protein
MLEMQTPYPGKLDGQTFGSHCVVFGLRVCAGRAPVLTRLHSAVEAVAADPWQLTFSYGRALQDPALAAWGLSDVPAAQAALAQRARCNAAATEARYERALEAVG